VSIDRGSLRERVYARRLLFGAAVLFIPTPFVMIVVGGMVPLAWTLVFFLHGAVVAIPKLTAEGFFILGILLAHLLVVGGVLFLVSALLSRLLFSFLNPRLALVAVGLILLASAAASSFDIYRIPGHSSARSANLLELLDELSA
jgi:hypothetical protein